VLNSDVLDFMDKLISLAKGGKPPFAREEVKFNGLSEQ
jgi:hypothetical protein